MNMHDIELLIAVIGSPFIIEFFARWGWSWLTLESNGTHKENALNLILDHEAHGVMALSFRSH